MPKKKDTIQTKDLEYLRKIGIEPFGKRFERTHSIKEIIEKHSGIKPGEKDERVKVKVAGRIRAIRTHGKLSFADIEDFFGRIQVFVSAENLDKKMYDVFQKLNPGDIIGVEGGIIKTKKGELSVLVNELTLLTKALKPLPKEWFGLKDVETRYRRRSLDFLMNPKARDIMLKRTKIIQSIREFLDNKDFIEFETPVLQPVYGGALARPFVLITTL